MRTILQGDCREALKALPDASVQCCVTSPPYWGLRDYGVAGQIGHETTPQEYVATMVEVFREVRRVLKDDGTVWLNLGDSYAGSGKGAWDNKNGGQKEVYIPDSDSPQCDIPKVPPGLKPKDLVGIPWRVAFALQDDGWWLRSDIIWSKPNPMPESVQDRPTRAHEYIFLLTKSAKYYYDAAAIREPASEATIKEVMEGYNGEAQKDYEGNGVQNPSETKSRIIEGLRKRVEKQRGHGRRHNGFNDRWDAMTREEQQSLGANKRSVWTVAPSNYKEAHFATFPPALIRPCILAGTKPMDVVLDPFGGSGTTGEVAMAHGRQCFLIELNPDYLKFIERRTQQNGLPL